ncbi:2-hydroxyacid dehydrogenase [Microlunatus endophyticus]|uniref:2-hydroxyacid dehydrogenase n=1 Tax=Microlunatus endophyticus TaxID=1716077 RepID=A0A917S3N6_9ACTN|nr:2-hydroxyacid dehydrogenase [Microlunatus endophyticus]GGL53193.1 2-hydroxyacid dehydrogenase [Microlunatus endophyticus]
MDKLVAVITDGNLRGLADELQTLVGEEVELRWPSGLEQTRAALADADAIVGGRFDAELACVAPRLRLVQVSGAGTDGVDRTALGPDVVLANTYHHEDAMAEYAIWAAIGLRRGLPTADAQLREQRWTSPAQDPGLPLPLSLAGARVGLYGFGHVGERAWRAFASFGSLGAAVTGRGSVDAAEHGLQWAGGPDELLRLCAESDILLVSPPLTAETRGAVGAAEIDVLGPDGILINVARGPVVDDRALYEALRDHRLGAAAIDVWYNYPPPGTRSGAPASLPFADLDNILMTPHISGVARATFEGRISDIAANLLALRAGRPLINLTT